VKGSIPKLRDLKTGEDFHIPFCAILENKQIQQTKSKETTSQFLICKGHTFICCSQTHSNIAGLVIYAMNQLFITAFVSDCLGVETHKKVFCNKRCREKMNKHGKFKT